ncbi:hypothetical protein [Deinococcus sp. QL22]|uniref:hypothetical protein n=1 Tax=Deinococcus sp. QL22 TaxID=2939437 RepID=UPI002017FA28|nr:hypothetical protein [Deinococcus sp. QL22]UQN06575.1 hypothetical protein M1R55_01245 [Deinococcus sp. QL22]
MTLRPALLAAVLLWPAWMGAQAAALPELPPTENWQPIFVEPAPIPVGSSVGMPSPPVVVPIGLTATLTAPRNVVGRVPLSLSVANAGAAALRLGAARDNDQNCALAPLVRVLRVGTREVVYPVAGEPRLCAQDFRTDTAGKGEAVTYTRDLDLPPGEHMIEGWFAGSVNGASANAVSANAVPIKLSAQPVRVTVR